MVLSEATCGVVSGAWLAPRLVRRIGWLVDVTRRWNSDTPGHIGIHGSLRINDQSSNRMRPFHNK